MNRLFLATLALATLACQPDITPWEGPTLTNPRNQLTVEHLLGDTTPALLDMSYFAQPQWAKAASHSFSGAISFTDTEMFFPQERAPYPGENIFPAFTVDFISAEGKLVPIQRGKIITQYQSESHWDVVVGAGKVWQEESDGQWSRASFPLTLTDRYIGQARNCVATFVYQPDSISQVCLQCSQETADLNDLQVGNMQAMLKATYDPTEYAETGLVLDQYRQKVANRLPVFPLGDIDHGGDIADYFSQNEYTNASTSQGAILLDGRLFVHPPQTRHGPYPYPAEMRHGVYSFTKSMAGALSLLYLAQRYGPEIMEANITDYVPALADHPGWQGVTFSQTLNMVTGRVGGEGPEHLLNVIILASTAEEAINNVATLGDAPVAPGEQFNYASTNLFVLSYAMQQYVAEQEGTGVGYWELVQEHVLKPIGAEDFVVLRTQEGEGVPGIPWLAYGALPTLDEAAKISRLFASQGYHQGQPILNVELTFEALRSNNWEGHDTNKDYRGEAYMHSFWVKNYRAHGCSFNASYMLGYGGNYVVFLPSGSVILRFMDEYDLDIRSLIRRVENGNSSCDGE